MTVASPLDRDVGRVCDLIARNLRSEGRTIVGIAGPPASGKSTLAEAVVSALNAKGSTSPPRATLLPMDGFHLDNRILESRGLLARKGAPETFNATGFCEAVRGLAKVDHEAYFPRFDRQMDLAIANAIAVQPGTSVIVVEGNYLLLPSKPWITLRHAFASTVFVSPARDTLHDRLVQRWLNHGLDRPAAVHRAESNDLPNADLVLEHSTPADLVLSQDDSETGARYVD